MKKILRICLFLSAFLFVFLIISSILALSRVERSVNPSKPLSDRSQIVFHFAALVPARNKDLFFIRAYNGMKETADREKAALQVFEYQPGKDSTSIKALLELILNTNPDGLIISIPGNAVYEEVLSRIKEKNIPVVNLEHSAVSGGRDAYIGTNEFELGRLAGSTAEDLLPSGGEVGILMPESPGRNSAQNTGYIRGFRQAVRERPDIQIRLVRSYPDTTIAGEEFIREILSDYPEIDVAVFTNPVEALGGAQALIEYGRVGTPLLITADDSPEIRKLMEMGVVSASIVRHPENAGSLAVETLVSLARNERANAYIDSGASVLLPEDLKRMRHP